MPGCHNASPLHNRIPEWLQAAARGELEHAAQIAHSTSPMPEVCGRLCPQHRLCEGACTLAPGPGAVAIGAVERGITELDLERGWRPSPVAIGRCSVGVIGAGSAGLACAEGLARHGIAVTVYDREPDIVGLLTHPDTGMLRGREPHKHAPGGSADQGYALPRRRQFLGLLWLMGVGRSIVQRSGPVQR